MQQIYLEAQRGLTMQSAMPFQRVLEDEYLSFVRFIEECNHCSYTEFDNYTLERINLFITPKDEHFLAMELALDKIICALPALKRIFSKPIIRLKDVQNILPVESVRVINNQSVTHVSGHSELWGDITKDGLKPRKLMTLDRQEDYAIYENVAFSRLIDYILAFVKKNILLLKDIMYANRELRFNLLERINHLHYFLAIGKLHMGYVRAQNQQHKSYERCLEKLLFIDKTLRSKMHAPIYRHCKKNKTKLTLKKTNVFRLHKDYRQVYALLKWFLDGKEEIDETLNVSPAPKDGYAAYCTLLSLFSMGHFNFYFGPRKRFDLSSINTSCSYKDWNLAIKRVSFADIDGLRFTVKKEKTHRICLIFASDQTPINSVAFEKFKKKYEAEEYLFASPVVYGEKDYVYLSLFDIDSFRRIQQLLLRGMVYADEQREVCPFCGNPLKAENNAFVCNTCKTEILTHICSQTKETYFTTNVRINNTEAVSASQKEKFLVDKCAEAQWHYRNITPVTTRGSFLCPKCGRQHETSLF